MVNLVIASNEENVIIDKLKFELEGIGYKTARDSFDNFDKKAKELHSNFDIVLYNYNTLCKKPESCYLRDVFNGVFIVNGETDEINSRFVADWVGTPHLRAVKRGENQFNNLLKEVLHLIGYPKSYEIERKFLIKYPDLKYLESLPNCKGVKISQTYIKRGKNGESIRVRKRGDDSDCIYVKTVKVKISQTKRLENEYYISQCEYKDELKNADIALKPINKIRYCLMHNNTYFEIDIFPFWKSQAYAEVELLNENDIIEFPKFIHVIREVTNDVKYTNHSLAKNIPDEK